MRFLNLIKFKKFYNKMKAKSNNIFQVWTKWLIFVLIIICLFFLVIYRIIKRGIFGPVYNHFLEENWPIVSKTDEDGSILNIAYPDGNIAYYVASFSTKNKVSLSGRIPDNNNMYFWSLTIYRENGSIYQSINDIEIDDKEYLIEIDRNTITTNTSRKSNIKKISPPVGDTYCVIQRVYKRDIRFQLVPNYIPNIVVNDGKVKIKNVMDEERIINSNLLQDIFTKLFTKKFERININDFFKVNVNKFFLPAESEMSLVFPNPYAKYLMVFPYRDSNVIYVKGILQKNIGVNNNSCRYVSFMASSFYTTSTDNFISFKDLRTNSDGEYILYVGFSEKDAKVRGYDSRKENHNLLLWKEGNEKPVLVYRLVSTEKKSNEENSLFSINNKVNNIGYEKIRKTYKYVPYVIN